MTFEESIASIVRTELAKALASLPPPSALRFSEWMTPEQAAQYCDKCEGTLRNWRKQGLKFTKRGKSVLYKKSDLDSFLSEEKPTAEAVLDQFLKRM